MHTLKSILIVITIWAFNSPFVLAQDVATRFNMNTDASAFPATSYGRPNYSSIRYSPKGTYLVIQSEHEVKCFETATGRVIYQSNGGRDIPGLSWKPSYKSIDYEVSDKSLEFTLDEKYLRIRPVMRGGYANLYFYQYIDLTTGKSVPEGPLFKELDGEKPEVNARIARNRFLKVKRPYSDKNRPEATS